MTKFKLKNIIKKLSAICGVFAVCGLSLFFVHDNKKETQKVDAVETSVILYEETTSDYYAYTSSSTSVRFYVTSTLRYMKYFNASNVTYGYSILLSYYHQTMGDSYYLYNGVYEENFTSFYETPRYNIFTNSQTVLLYVPTVLLAVTQGQNNRPYFSYSCDFDLVFVGLSSEYEFNGSFSGYSFMYHNGVVVNDRGIATNQLHKFNFTSTSAIASFSVTASSSDYNNGYNQGYDDGYVTGYENGNMSGYTNGYNQGYDEGVASQSSAIQQAYQQGYSAGLLDGSSESEVTATAFSGILRIGLLPIDFFLSIFNFELLGINLTGFIVALISVVLTYILIKKVL